ncbi:MAG: hypothetical protein A3G39_04400 [Deltaproteobacteria bacterium RIFCSPLOWO2_12_FULL_43_16]|nr:MAG: hypothetical protein A2Z89_04340 [Deltaproteobacteria bacterium GWA2_43_19]OGQ11087.1 MAG: hypothetical protein A3D30_00530 [Deltaproteobacteria bacterium RIFCSPHIGHO2_02_FULL_43_33]OGQ60331.1 MAG: hypothetical protein A3G39_04400 [Deltaproteobacteria bacterium RIFCSPLOWO2_12_FULL_43_16]HBR18482.1 hypothetical protein [Deltaproteobacteria bacterium]
MNAKLKIGNFKTYNFHFTILVKRAKGFTLIEVLVALTILSMILSIIFAVMRFGISSWEKGSKLEERIQYIRTLTTRLNNEIGSMYPYIVSVNGVNVFMFRGERDKLGFVTTNEDAMPDIPRGGTKWVYYFIDRDKGLAAREKMLPNSNAVEDKEGNLVIIEPSVKEMRFEYLDINGWVDSWNADEKKGIPKAIRINLIFEHKEPISMIVPVALSSTEAEREKH